MSIVEIIILLSIETEVQVALMTALVQSFSGASVALSLSASYEL